MTGRVVVDTSVYIDVLRDRAFAATFRPLYERGIPRTHLSSVVAQELLAGARTAAHRRLAQALVEPFERARRVVHPRTRSGATRATSCRCSGEMPRLSGRRSTVDW